MNYLLHLLRTRSARALLAGAVSAQLACTNFDRYHSPERHGGRGATPDASTSGGAQNGGSGGVPGGGAPSAEGKDAGSSGGESGGGARAGSGGSVDASADEHDAKTGSGGRATSSGQKNTKPPFGALMWDTPEVPVCFTVAPHIEPDTGRVECSRQTTSELACNGEQITGSLAPLRDRVRALVENSWQRYGSIEFRQGTWKDCDRNGDGLTALTPKTIQVTFESSCDGAGSSEDCPQADEAPWDELRGSLGMSGLPTDVHLDWKRILAGVDDARVVHEFGHALGFSHTSAGYTTCSQVEQGDYAPGAGFPIAERDFAGFDGTNDKESVMGPCPSYPGRHAVDTLSAADVLGFQRWFGRKVPGSLAGRRGLCAMITGEDGGGGPDVVPGYCRGRASAWKPAVGADGIRLECTSLGLCLSRDQTSTEAQALDCADTSAQTLAMTGVEWRAEGNLCVARAINRLWTAYCDGSPGQRWDFVGASGASYGSLRLTATNLCATVVEPYGYLELLPCVDSSPQQKFAYSPDGAINYLASPPARVTVSDAQEKPGGYIFRSSNDASSDASNDAPAPYYQQFYFSGTVRAYDAPSVGGDEGGTPATQCLRTDPKGIFDKDHLTTIGFVDCDDADANQRWDYYFQ